MIDVMRKAMTCLALAVLLACSTDAQQPAPGTGGDEVAARIGERAVTLRELDEKWRANDPAQHAQATQALYSGRRSALDALVAEMLIDQAAKAQNVAPAQYVDAEVGKRFKPVSDSEIAVFYGENRAQMQGRSLEQMSELIRGFLDDQRRTAARAALVADLRKAGPDVRVLIDPPRQQVAIGAGDPSEGRADAPVTLVEFSDFQCPFCRQVVPTIKQLRDKYGDRLRVVWKDFPLTQIHPEAFDAARAGNCAAEQEKFWQFHDRLFGNQQMLQISALKEHAVAVGMDGAKFSACLDSGKYDQEVKAAIAAGTELGVGSTPTVYINGRALSGAQPYDVFAGVIEEELQRTTRR